MKARAILLASMWLAGCQSQYDDGSLLNKRQGILSASAIDANNADSSLDWLTGSDGQYQELWAYISAGMSIKVPQNSRVQAEKARYTRSKEYLPRVAVRAEPYMYWIVTQIKQRNMPIELALLPIVESEFNPHVVSPAKAAGIWQIVPTTGLYYGLKQDEWYDGRQDVMASTTAALDLLQRLNGMFDGDWLLTIAAYNSGEGRILNAIKSNKSKGKKIDFWSLNLPKETAAYVPRLLALSDVIKNAPKYNIVLPRSNPNRALGQIEVTQQIELSQVAKMTGLPLSNLSSFNAGYRHQVTPPNGPHIIAVPKSHLAILRQALMHQKNSLVVNARYTIKEGDKLERIANSLSSHEKAIINLNGLDEDVITPGNTLSIPMYSANVTGSFFENKRSEQQKKIAPRRIRYTVVSGDTLSTVSKKLGVKAADLQKWNKLQTHRLKLGQTLIYLVDKENTKKITYSVQRGDTMTSIAQKYGLDINDVLSWNRTLPDIHRLRLGDELTLYIIK